MADVFQEFSDTGLLDFDRTITAPAVWLCQTFTPDTTHSVQNFELYLRRNGNPAGTLTASIRATDTGAPTGSDLDSATLFPASLDTSYGWATFAFSPSLALTVGVTYAIVLRVDDVDAGQFVEWAEVSTGGYTVGRAGTSVDSGSSWTVPDPGSDMLFRESGNLAPFSYTETAQIGLSASIVTAATYTRELSVAVGLKATLTSELKNFLFLCVGSEDEGSVKTSSPVGASWDTLATDGSKNLASTWLAQFLGRLCVLSDKYTGFSYSDVNDIVANWTEKASFPNYPGNFNGMFEGRDAGNDPALYFLTPTGVFYMDVFSKFVFGKTELQWEEDRVAGKKGIYFRGAHYIAVGKTIYEMAGGVVNLVGPDMDDGFPAHLQGAISDIIGVGFWLVIAIDGGAGQKSGIYKRYLTGKHWHPVYVGSTNTPIRALLWDSGTLYFGEGTNVKTLPMSNKTDNVKLDSDHTFAASGSIYYPRFHSEFEAIPKVAHKARWVGRNCDSTRTVVAQYRIDSDTDWTTLGTWSSSPRPTALSFGVAGVEFESIEMRLNYATDDSGKSAETEALTLEFEIVPPVLWGFDFNVVARTDEDHEGQELIDAITTMAGTTTLLPFYPDGDKTDGTVYYVRMKGLPRAQDGTEFGQEGEYRITVQEVTD
jgi:hypothetical protein